VDSLADALARTGETATHLATLDDKAKTGVFRAFARSKGLPIIGVPTSIVEGIETPTQSQASMDAKGTGSVAEAVALYVAGPGAILTKRRSTSADQTATCAIATGPDA
ncbi:MAG: cobalamin biosynthesis protein, partial [Pseudomonadota bacterium]